MEDSSSKLRHRNVPLLLLQAREAVLSRFRPYLNQHGVTEQQWRVIRAIHENGPMEPRDIEQICCFSSPSLTGILVRMTALGWISRCRHEHDQRRLWIALTPKALQLVSDLAPLVEAEYRKLESLIGPEFVGLLYDMLDAMVERLGTPGDVAEE